MISEKANKKLYQFLSKLPKEAVNHLALVIAAKNVLVQDFTKKGEVVIKPLEVVSK